MANTKRVPLSQKTRFEVFKRDSFKCQYCGKSAPDVVLHVDHIKPVAKGGTNDIFNLITSCAGCNSGKGARQLSDNATIQKQKKQLDELNDRREQLELMMQWQKELMGFKDEAISIIEQHFVDIFGSYYYLYTSDKTSCANLCKKYGLDEVLNAIDIANSNGKLIKHDWRYIGGVLRMRQDEKVAPVKSCANYAYYILYKKFEDDMDDACGQFGIDTPKNLVSSYVYRASVNGLLPDDIIALARSVFSFNEFCQSCNKEVK